MFEVGFTELLLIFALALIVLGPERLPRVASQVGRWIGRARAMARQFREQLEEEADLESMSSRRRPASQTAPQPSRPAPPQPAAQPQPATPQDDFAHTPNENHDGDFPPPRSAAEPAAPEETHRPHERGT